ncbi:MAG TPA: glycerol-3-phosphate 1-O-acyltransferase PlsY [Thermoanaerobaculia bacterium]|nr:glycerol-3-phosphate 1-O-acyltransferase PlsY [Thermoanaerobaculia bacterium]
MLPAALLLASYLIGSIPFSYLVARAVSGGDIRNVGSGNVGATNVARSVGTGPGAVALILDAAKGWGAVMLARLMVESPLWPPGGGLLEVPSFWIAASAVTAVLGHMAPVWLRFRGGKGVATAAGVFLAIDPRAVAIVLVLFVLVTATTRLVSLGSILTAAAMPLVLRYIERQTFWIVLAAIVIALAIIVRHRANIARLAAGSEPRFPR